MLNFSDQWFIFRGETVDFPDLFWTQKSLKIDNTTPDFTCICRPTTNRENQLVSGLVVFERSENDRFCS